MCVFGKEGLEKLSLAEQVRVLLSSRRVPTGKHNPKL
jgi:hypothetical protein